MIVITGKVELNEVTRSQAIELAKEHSRRSRKEDGCISHNCYLNAENPCELHFFEKWHDMEAVQTHFSLPESRAFVRSISELARSDPKIEISSSEPIQSVRL